MFENPLPGHSFRPASEDDLPRILELEQKSYPLPWTEEAFRQELTKPFSNFIVLTDDETDSQVVGYIVFWLLFDECHILNVTVDPGWRGLGIATRLVRQAINSSVKKELKRAFLEVRKSNNAAVALYQKLGFFIDHVKKNFYDDGEDAYFMVRFLDRKSDF